MVTKEEFEHFIAEVESFRDMVTDEITDIKTEIEDIKEKLEEVIKQSKVDVNKKIG